MSLFYIFVFLAQCLLCTRSVRPPVDLKLSIDLNIGAKHLHVADIDAESLDVLAASSNSKHPRENFTVEAPKNTSEKLQSRCTTKLDLYFVIGCGLSCPNDEVWGKIKGWVEELVSHFQLDDEHARAMVVKWSTEGARVPCSTHRSMDDLLKACASMKNTTIEALKDRSKAGDKQAQNTIKECARNAKKDIDTPRPPDEASVIGDNFKQCVEDIKRTPATAGHLDQALQKVKGGKGRKEKVIVLVDERHHYPQPTLLAAKALTDAAECDMFEGQKQCMISVAVGQDERGMIPNSFAIASEPKERNFFVVRTNDKQYEKDKQGDSDDVRLVSSHFVGRAPDARTLFYNDFTKIVKPILGSISECADVAKTL